ncbi:MAG: hypothetical protein H6R19_2010 [Proteobacteria bacterium]|nr:hypothetical protein [Pseudomonadota bacterium]
MKTPMLRSTLVAAMMLAFCGSASAAGLGRINVLSSLGQPLRAEVELMASAEELDNMVVRMASPEAYKRANVEFLNALSGVKMSVERRGTTEAVVRITSDKPFSEPFVDLLIDLNWAGGRLQREFTFLLDPAEMSGPKPVAAVVPPVSRTPESKPFSRPVVEGAPVASSRAESAPSAAPVVRERSPKPQSSGEDYAVKRGDNLSKIANEVSSGEVTQEQMIAALYRANSEAFIGGNINRLRAGRILKVPQAGEVVQIPKAEARRIILKASNFEQYRQTVASSAVAAPARETSTGQAASGKIAPKVEEKLAPSQQTKDKVKVTAAETGKPGAAAATTDAATKARLQTLQDDIASREKALKEANSRVSDLEKNVKELQKLIELKNQGLADAQKQASAAQAAAKAAESRADKAEKIKAEKLKADQDKKLLAEQSASAIAEVSAPTPAPVAEVSAPVVEQSSAAPVIEAPSAPAVVEQSVAVPTVSASPVAAAPVPVEEEGGLFRNLGVVLGLGVVAAGIGYVVLKQRRKQAAAGSGNTQLTESSTTSPNSVFGSAGGQTVDTGGTSLLHTDFSQSGMSAIDADEGVDPVAEADVYMAYGRDAQAEEILLDALKNDPSRTAVYVKLLEIYAQRRSLKQFENIATDLYTQSGGVGDDWSKAAALGAKLDPNNPLYKSTVLEQPAPAEAAPENVASEPVAVPEIPVVEETPAVSFGTNNISQVRSTWTVPGEIGQFTAGEGNLPVIPEAAPVVTPVPEALNLDFNLDLDSPSTDDQPTQVESREDEELLPSMDEAIATQPSIIGEEAPLEFDIGLDDDNALSATTAGIDAPQRAEITETDFDIGIETDGDHEALSEVDLEKTNFEGSLLDFDFELGDEPEKPALDLSSVNLNTTGMAEPAVAAPAPVVSMEPIQDSIDVNDEVSTKLELAKAYEEMGDMEGARELLEEVISDGADFQKDQAKTMLGRIG